MTHPLEQAFALKCNDNSTPPVLTGVKAHGRLDGVLFSLTLQQTYRNDSERNLEVIYTFPLPSEAVLLSFAAELGGQWLQGTILPCADAEQRYEQALAVGDAPALLEVSAGGLHTASIGNLQPGESVRLEVRFAQILRFEQGRLRVVLPTTLAPRYGNPTQGGPGGLKLHQVPVFSLVAEYPLQLSVTISGSMAQARIQCPTHPHLLIREGDCTKLELAPGASLDRDVVLIVQPAEPRPDLLLTAADPLAASPQTVALAAFELPRRPARRKLSLKLLVDCSGSMAGDSMASAHAALHGIADLLGEADEVALSRFGNQVEHVMLPACCTSDTVGQLRSAIDATTASMGGTEMQRALMAVFTTRSASADADVLLITDGQVWQATELARAARASGHRVFVIGVGSSPAQSVLRDLARASGGACEFATPGEALPAAAARMLVRMREQAWTGLEIDWGSPPLWQQALPAHGFGGDTLLAFATFKPGQTPAPSVRLLQRDAADTTVEVLRSAASAECASEDLARLAAAARCVELQGDAALQTALNYRLLTDRTHCVLVHERAEADRTSQAAEMYRVPSMLAAGWGGAGRVQIASGYVASPLPIFSQFELASPPESRSSPVTLVEIAERVAAFLGGGGSIIALAEHCRDLEVSEAVREALRAVQALGADAGQGWLLLAAWVAERGRLGGATPTAVQWAPHLATVTTVLREQAWELFVRELGVEDGTARSRRLASAVWRGA